MVLFTEGDFHMNTIKTVVASILIALIVIFFINALAPYSTDGVMDATFFSKNNHDIQLEFTEDTEKLIGKYDNDSSDIHEEYEYDSEPIMYLHIGDNSYKGNYTIKAKGFKKIITISLYDTEFEFHEPVNQSDTYVIITLQKEGNNLKFLKGFGAPYISIFNDNNKFHKKTWWNTWGLKLCIILIVAFILWLLRIPEFITNKKYREKSINVFKESKKEYDKEKEKMRKDYEEEVSEYTDLMKEGINDFKDEMKNVKEGVNEMKDSLKRGFEEYKNNKKKD